MGEMNALSNDQIINSLALTLKPFEQLSNIEQQIENCEHYITHTRDLKKKTKITVAIIILVVLDVIVLVSGGFVALMYAMMGMDNNFMGKILVILLIINILVIALAIVIMINKKKSLEMKAQKAECDLEVFYQNRYQVANVIRPYIQFLPNKYRNRLSVEKIYEYICSGRAESLKEAMNLLEEELFRMRQEARSEQMVQLQQMQNTNIEMIRTNTASTASAVEEIANVFR